MTVYQNASEDPELESRVMASMIHKTDEFGGTVECTQGCVNAYGRVFHPVGRPHGFHPRVVRWKSTYLFMKEGQ